MQKYPTIHSQSPNLISQPVRDHLGTLLKEKPLVKGNGDYEIGYEQAKRDIKESLQALIGGFL